MPHLPETVATAGQTGPWARPASSGLGPGSRVLELVLRYEELAERGEGISPEELCRDCPELLEEVKGHLSGLRRLERRLHPAPSQEQPFPDLPGYEVLAELGRGGMGVVYKARQVALKRLVALKMILAADHASPEQVARFRSEAEAAARLQHPNIVGIYEVGEAVGRPFFSLEYVAGGSLAGQLDGTPLPARRAAELAETLARAVDAAHRRGIVHRDLKPANVLLMEDGTPKITDFGLARKLDEAGQTQTGAILGTPSYMAPEQAGGRSKEVGPATDVYALGAILYELVTGRPPFRAATPLETILQVRSNEPVPPRRLQPATPRDLETVILKCLHKEPARRYASAAALADDLRRFLDGRPVLARPVGWAEQLWRMCRRNPVVASLTAAVVLLLLGVAVASLVVAANMAGQRNALAKAEAEASSEAHDADVARKKAEASAEERSKQLGQYYVGRGAERLAEHDALGALPWFAEALRWDHDNPARAAAHRTRVAACLKRCPRLLHVWPAGQRILCARFSPDGRFIATGEQDGIARLWDGTTGAPAGPPLKQEGRMVLVSFSPDGRRLLTVSHLSRSKVGKSRAGLPIQARVWDPVTGRQLGPTVTENTQGMLFLRASLSPDGRHIVTFYQDLDPPADEDIDSQSCRVWEVASGKRLDFPLAPDARLQAVHFSQDGRRLLAVGSKGTALVWDTVTGAALAPPLAHDPGKPAALKPAALSPDGTRVLTLVEGKARLWDAATGKAVAPALEAPAVVASAFSPDGRLLAIACEDGKVHLWQAATGEQKGKAQMGPVGPGESAQLVWSSDGRRLLAFSAVENFPIVMASGPSVVGVWDASGQLVGPPLKTSHPVQTCSFAPDGSQILSLGGAGVASVGFPRAGGSTGLGGWTGIPGLPVAASGSWPVLGQLVGPQPLGLGAWGGGQFNPLLQGGFSNLGVGGGIVGFAGGGMLGMPRAGNTIPEVRVWGPARMGAEPASASLAVKEIPAVAAFTPDGDRVLTVSSNEVRLWDAESGLARTPPLNAGDWVRMAWLSPDGCRLLTVGVGQTRLWDVAGDSEDSLDLEHETLVTQAAFSPDGSRVVTVTTGKEPGSRESAVELAGPGVHLWEAATGHAVGPPLPHPGPVYTVAFSADGRRLLTVCRSQQGRSEARVWDAATGKPLTAAWKLGEENTLAVRHEFRADGRQVLAVGADGRAHLWDAQTGKEMPPLGHAGLIQLAQLSPDSRLVLTLAQPADEAAGLGLDPRPHEMALWDAQSGKARLQGYHTHALIMAPVFSPDGTTLVTGDEDGTARVWDLGADRPTSRTLPEVGKIQQAVFARDSRRVLFLSSRSVRSASADSAGAGSKSGALVWDLERGQPITPLWEHEGGISTAAFSGDGRRVAICGGATIRIWDVESGAPLTPPLHSPGDPPPSVTFSPDGETLFVRTSQGTLALWQAATGQPLAPPLHGSVWGMSRDGRSLLLSPHSGRTVRIWRAPSDERPDEELLRLAGVLSGRRLDASGGLELLASDALSRELAACRTQVPNLFRRTSAECRSWHRRQARLCLDRGHHFAAGWHLDRLLAERPDEPELLYERGGFHFHEAERQLHSLPPRFDEAKIHLREALALFRRAVERRPAYWQAWHERARVAEKLGRTEEALAAYSRVVALQPHLGPVWRQRAILHARLGHWDQAVADYSSALEQDPFDIALWQGRAGAQMELGRWREAAADLDAALRLVRFEANLELAAAADANAEAARAQVQRSRAVHVQLLSLRARVALHGKGAGPEYRGLCRRLVKALPPEGEPATVRIIVWTCALAPAAVDDYAPLVAAAEKTLAPARKDSDNLTTCGAVLYRAGRFKEAVQRLDQAVRAQGKGGSAEDHFFLAMAQQRLGHRTEALSWLERAGAAKAAPPASGDRRRERDLLYREAEEVVRGSPSSAPR